MKRLSLTLAALLAAGSAQALMEPATPESQGVSSQAILDWIDACEREFPSESASALHGFVIVRHGKVVAEGSWKPYDTLRTPHMLYSHSKSFTASAVGMLADDGKLDLDERVVDLFPGEAPADPCENVRQLRVRDLLTMNVGATNDHTAAKCRVAADWARKFFDKDFTYAPGTRFRYDSDATYMLACIVERKSGMSLMDFLKRRMFDKIGIAGAWSTVSPQGVACGGWGMNMTTRDLARFGQLYLRKGEWEGERVLSRRWVELATARQTWSGSRNVGVDALGSGSDWNQGYGFQFWRCRHDCYRADGAAGQYTVVMPGQDAVVSIHAGVGDLAKELQLVWDHLLPAMKPGALPEDPERLAALRGRIAALEIRPLADIPKDAAAEVDPRLYGEYEVADNPRGIRSVGLAPDGAGWRVTFLARNGASVFPVGRGGWRRGAIRVDGEGFESLGALCGELATAASGAVREGRSLKCRAFFTGGTHHLDLHFAVCGGVPCLEGELWGMGGTKFTGKPVRR